LNKLGLTFLFNVYKRFFIFPGRFLHLWFLSPTSQHRVYRTHTISS